MKLLTVAEVVVQSSPNSATNDSARGYSVNPFYAELVRKLGETDWELAVKNKLSGVEPLAEKLKKKRHLNRIDVSISKGQNLSFSAGKHNELQKAIIEDFLPRYGFGAELLYVGDTADKYLFLEKKKLAKLNFFELAHEELPDVIAYSKKKNWLYLIEAVHTSGPINEIRLMELQRLTKNCNAEIVYVTAFLDRQTFRKWIAEVAWETEVWIADNPDHLVHFNGDKFLGPYKQ